MSHGGKNTDKFGFTFKDAAATAAAATARRAGSCVIDACSESQVLSVYDYSTNYCNLYNLYCGKADGCTPVLHDFTSTVKIGSCLSHDATACLK